MKSVYDIGGMPGVMEINTSTSYQAEQAVKAMFSGLDVVIRYTNSF